jgi:alkanesulfonate monooxygenase SsuD/methylene tetrahydromethanopterin reductase-like flavin-dependent oxidoreductase (luciferase family)
VKVGVLVPYLIPTTRASALAWVSGVEDGPFDSIAVGERVTFHNIDQTVMLAAAAALTSRVRLYTHVVIAPMHPPALLAKRLASIDVISGGRLTVSVGTGGREHDYRAAGMPMTRTFQGQDASVAEMKRLWAGEPAFPGADPVGPTPVQVGGPPVYTSARGPKSIARAVKWAEGFTGAALSGLPADMAAEASSFLERWEAAGGTSRPHLGTSVFYALGEDAGPRMRAVTERYFTVGGQRPPTELVDAMLSAVISDDAVRTALDGAVAAGYDEVTFITTTDDVADLARLADVVSRWQGS